MSLQEELLDLETAVYQVSRRINAIELMSIGLCQTQDPYADGLSAVCADLLQASQDLRKHMDLCLKAV